MHHEALEYKKLKEILKRYTLSSLGNRRVDQLQPSCDFDVVQYGVDIVVQEVSRQ